MIDWNKEWHEYQELEIDPEWIDRIKQYDFENDEAIQHLMRIKRLGMERRPLMYRSTQYGPTRYSTIMVDQTVAYVVEIKKDEGIVVLQFAHGEDFLKLKEDVDADGRDLLAAPRCFIDATTQEIKKFITFDIMRSLK